MKEENEEKQRLVNARCYDSDGGDYEEEIYVSLALWKWLLKNDNERPDDEHLEIQKEYDEIVEGFRESNREGYEELYRDCYDDEDGDVDEYMDNCGFNVSLEIREEDYPDEEEWEEMQDDEDDEELE